LTKGYSRGQEFDADAEAMYLVTDTRPYRQTRYKKVM